MAAIKHSRRYPVLAATLKLGHDEKGGILFVWRRSWGAC
jgi:hypothetical protein